ncbi:tissue inhibitor of metalloproteinase [Diabrotica virgifera virgifera]|uniref:NTR domain-containing protein n=1 Tax=Diabrotica virgifera virgifera TaxID=50390 RepID=A0ABM5JP01_DIAVI|nr:tissue inhibitor of metalloproteinase [Diabrotica virgifera virgifera]
MNSNVLFVTLAFFCGVFVCSDACSCMPQHPQEHFCNSDFVILARVKRERILGDTKVYKVRVRKEYKVSDKGVLALKSGRLLTPKYGAMCGVDLEVGKLYVISGNIVTLKAQINMCGMRTEWNQLTRRQRKGLRVLYRHGCTCKIRRCSLGKRCYRQRDSCTWRNSCETKEGICLRQPNKSCMWARTRLLTTCSREWRRNVTMSSSYHQYNNFAFHH